MRNIFRKRDGFTLVELIVVIAVLIILMAIAIPAYLSVRDSASDTGVKSDLTVAYKNAAVALAEEGAGNFGDYPGADDAAKSAALVAYLADAEPGLTFEVDDATYDGETIDVEVAAGVLTMTSAGSEDYVIGMSAAGVQTISWQ
ncbi:type II secretion system protein [Miltoncostaea oceani]|uniref:type II secretion system protein n=1 Tax=Miltoncostaea oceani TaxID=2843216 RepID=UPI001C3E68E1|nr:type II secretion system protein [Miltoncostaea oceani]